MTDAAPRAANRFAMPLAALERQTRVPPAEQVTEGTPDSDGSAAWAWDEQRRQTQLAGGA